MQENINNISNDDEPISIIQVNIVKLTFLFKNENNPNKVRYITTTGTQVSDSYIITSLPTKLSGDNDDDPINPFTDFAHVVVTWFDKDGRNPRKVVFDNEEAFIPSVGITNINTDDHFVALINGKVNGKDGFLLTGGPYNRLNYDWIKVDEFQMCGLYFYVMDRFYSDHGDFESADEATNVIIARTVAEPQGPIIGSEFVGGLLTLAPRGRYVRMLLTKRARKDGITGFFWTAISLKPFKSFITKYIP